MSLLNAVDDKFFVTWLPERVHVFNINTFNWWRPKETKTKPFWIDLSFLDVNLGINLAENPYIT